MWKRLETLKGGQLCDSTLNKIKNQIEFVNNNALSSITHLTTYMGTCLWISAFLRDFEVMGLRRIYTLCLLLLLWVIKSEVFTPGDL